MIKTSLYLYIRCLLRKLVTMRITVEVDRSTLEELKRRTGMKKMSPAIAMAVEEYVRRRKARDFGRLIREGAFDYPMTNEEVESLDR